MKQPSSKELKTYRKLNRHFNTMPIRLPATPSGKHLALLKHFFSENEAEIAMGMDFSMQSAESICSSLKRTDIENVTTILMGMVRKGGILYRKEGPHFALVPFVVGMYEFQAKRLSKPFFKTAIGYMVERFGFEFLTTRLPQTRIIPINEKVKNRSRIATYDELDQLLEKSEGRITIIQCICRIAADYEGKPCAISDRRELCLALNDYADMAAANNWGRQISVEEALELSRLNQEEGFVLQCANDQNPNFFCACCKDCYGLLEMYKAVPRPAEYVASNYRALVNEACIGCRKCIKICPMDAIIIKNQKAVIQKDRCIGCGVCTIKCPKDALILTNRETTVVPPETVDHLYEELAKSRFNLRKKTKLAIRYVGFKIKNLFLNQVN